MHGVGAVPPGGGRSRLRDGQLVVKWDLDHGLAMSGKANRKILKVIQELESEGLL